MAMSHLFLEESMALIPPFFPPGAPDSQSRRSFVGRMGSLTAGVLAASAGAPLPSTAADADLNVSLPGAEFRRNQAFLIRVQTAQRERDRPLPVQRTNGDEDRYPNRIGNFSKCLPHSALGDVDPAAYRALLHAMGTGRQADLEAIPMAGNGKLVNPQAAFTFDLEGADSHQVGLAAPPAYASVEQAGEMAEDYWMALTRDVAFSDYDSDPQIASAVADLGKFPRFAGVTPGTIFRGTTAGDLIGPHLSQLLWLDVPLGTYKVVQRLAVPQPGDVHLTSFASCLAIQNGATPQTAIAFDPTPRYIRNGHDLAEWVHRDFAYQAFLDAALILLSYGPAALDAANPYRTLKKQASFVTFGAPHLLDLVARVSNAALRAAWYQKWSVHRRVRPEAFAGQVHNQITGAARLPIDASLLNSQAVAEVFSRYGTYLLPMAYPEGCPAHPSYPAGHAAMSGACATVLKAFFDESFVIPNPKLPNSDGTALVPYTDAPLTLGGELNKLAANISLGRDVAGVHWRSDGIQGMSLGEAVAIRVLADFRATYSETFAGFSLTTFDGRTVSV
jgi:hypothetical protein